MRLLEKICIITLLFLGCYLASNISIKKFLSKGLISSALLTSSCLLYSVGNSFAVENSISTATNSITGIVSLNSRVVTPTSGPSVALYLTARAEEKLFGSKPPPLFIKKITNPTLPLTIQLSTDDLTPEGLALKGKYAQIGTELTVSARLDEDGVASTRGPNDLVGRGYTKYSNDGIWSEFTIDLTDREIGGKFITTKKQ